MSRPCAIALLAVPAVLILAAVVQGADPPFYQKWPTWQETMVASREALRASEGRPQATAAFTPYASAVLRGGEAARKIRLDVSGVQDLYLVVTGSPDPVGGAGDWGEAALTAPDGTTTRASRLPGISVLSGRHQFEANLKSGVNGPMSVAGRKFEHGIHVYAPSKLRLPLKSKFAWFEAWIGIDDWVGRRGAVRFDVTDAAGAARLDLWDLVLRDFPTDEPRREIRREREDRIWDADWPSGDPAALARRYAAACRFSVLRQEADSLAVTVRDAAGLAKVRQVYHRSRRLDEAIVRAARLDFTSLRLAVQDLSQTFGERYSQGPSYLARLEAIEKAVRDLAPQARARDLAAAERVAGLVAEFDRLQRESLLDNPLLDFDRLLLIRRVPHCDAREPKDTGYGMGEYLGLPRQTSKCNPGIEEPFHWENEIAELSPVRPAGKLSTVYRPDRKRLIGDLDLDWDARRLLFSMPGSHDKWQVWQVGADGRGLRQVTPGDQPDVHNYDPCWLPDGRIAFISTAPLQGVPCNAGVIVGMMYRMDADGRNIRQLGFEQDHDYCPTVLNDGRILYLRWDYTDTPHVWNRMLFAMNPDGTGQMEVYGANSYWPNAIFYARPVPGHPTKLVGIVTGHHVGRVGELVLFDPARGHYETTGVVQRIPGRGQKVEPVIEDKLTEHSWPKFLHPYPLSEKYFLVACKPAPDALWGIYLADGFDNLVLVKEVEGEALLEPLPVKKTPRPPVIPEKTQPGRKDALVYLEDVYAGPGLQGIPRGTVKKLRVFSYHFGYQRLAGIDHRIGADGPWEVKRILGTVAVEADGSALFRAPAKVPLSVQPLDAEGKALQLMRSWMTAMPGETLSCVGCHDNRRASPPSRATLALGKRPQEIAPWYGPPRGFSFRREVQPVLDRYCVSCHRPRGAGSQPASEPVSVRQVENLPHIRQVGNLSYGRQVENLSYGEPDLRGDQGRWICYRAGDPRPIERAEPIEKLLGRYGAIFEPSYIALRALVRVPGLESELRLLPATEFHADSSELVQMLKKGHYGVRLDAEAWDRLIAWIDLNAPCHGTWGEFVPISDNQRERRCQLQRLYGGVEEDGEEVPRRASVPLAQPMSGATLAAELKSNPNTARTSEAIVLRGWPFDAAEAARRQSAEGPPTRTLDLGGGVKLEMVRIPAGRFVMGDPAGESDEQPSAIVAIDRPFWVSRCEVTNRQFARFDPLHQSRYEHRGSWIFSEEYLGWPLDGPEQPVVRVAWNDAMAFARWLSDRTGLDCSLPTEAQWEYACRAGTATFFWYGTRDTDFSPFANLADATIRELAFRQWSPKGPDLVPRDERFNDGGLVSVAAGGYRPNPWGLCDVHGNVAEWTRTTYRPYPYREDGRSDPASAGPKTVRGGSWRDRPARCRSAFRLAYPPYQRAYNVGFRVVAAGLVCGKISGP